MIMKKNHTNIRETCGKCKTSFCPDCWSTCPNCFPMPLKEDSDLRLIKPVEEGKSYYEKNYDKNFQDTIKAYEKFNAPIKIKEIDFSACDLNKPHKPLSLVAEKINELIRAVNNLNTTKQ